jgi:hypothetical protein
MNVEEVSEEDLFNEAVSDETPDDPVVTEQSEQPEREVARDEAGRFAAKEEPVAEVVSEQVEKPAVDDNAPMVPSWRVREINDEKRALADRLAALEARLAQPAPKQEIQPPAKVERPDPLLDPEGYEKYLDEKFEAKRLNDRRDMDLALTRQANADAFDNAHNEAMRLKAAGDPAFTELSQKMNATLNPGKVLLKWHQERSMKAEIGDDLAAYKQRQREELLKDPEFLAKAVEAARASAQPQSNGRPRVELPPTLNGASRSNAMLRSANNDISDEELFREVAG